jgi:hypothetical protein
MGMKINHKNKEKQLKMTEYRFIKPVGKDFKRIPTKHLFKNPYNKVPDGVKILGFTVIGGVWKIILEVGGEIVEKNLRKRGIKNSLCYQYKDGWYWAEIRP